MIKYDGQAVKQFPMKWVMDGEKDCEDGMDEEPDNWLKCGEGRFVFF